MAAALFVCACGDPTSFSPDASSSSDAPSGTSPPARLVVSGATVRDPDGKSIVLRGYNWGQWGTAQPQDAADNAAQGANSVRLPLRWWGDWKPGVDSRSTAADAIAHIDPGHLAELDQDIAWASSQHLWIVLFVDSNFGQGADGSTDNFWTDSTMKGQFIEVWQFLADRYHGTPYIGAYEILPEPKPPGVSDADVKAFYDSMIPYLRAKDARTPIIVGPNLDYNLYHLDAAFTTADPNIIYTGNLLHYDPAKIPSIQAFMTAHDAPVWIDQIGIQDTDANSLGQADELFGDLRALDVGWAWWTYREQRMNANGYGIYYQDPNDETKWLVKPDWLDLMSRSFQ